MKGSSCYQYQSADIGHQPLTLPAPPPRMTVSSVTIPVQEKKSIAGLRTVLPSLRVAEQMHTNVTVARLVYTK